MRICLPPWDMPVGTPGRAFEGAQLLDAKFTVNEHLHGAERCGLRLGRRCSRRTTPARARRTPQGRSRPQSIVGTPSLSLKVKKTKTKGGYAAAGRLSQGGQAVSNATVVLLRGSTSSRLIAAGSTRTGTSGAWAKTGKVAGKKLDVLQGDRPPRARRDGPGVRATASGARSRRADARARRVGAFSVSSPVAKFKP